MALLLSCENLSKTFGARALFEGVSLSIYDGDRIGLIGPNGSGKSTLLKILAGLETADLVASGKVSSGKPAGMTMSRNLRVAYVAQQDAFDAHATALQIVADALADRLHDEHEREDRATLALAKVGLSDPQMRVGAMSGGWRKRLAITRELVREPDMLLLDEPTNHLDIAGVQWLEQMLQSQRFATVVITHDRCFLERAVTRIMELSHAYPTGILAVDGVYSTFLQRRAEFLDAQAQQQQSLASKVREDIRWLSRGAQARRTKSQSRIDASQERMTELADLKTRNAAARAADIEFTATKRQTRNLLVATGLSKTLGNRTLFRRLDLTLSPQTCIGLLGPNGSGKTTLIRVLTGELQQDEGVIKRAEGLRTVVFTQAREELDPRQSLREAIMATSSSGGGSDFLFFRGEQIHVITWAGRFLFRPEQLKVSVGDLSGGEQARILMARLMLKPADLLVLDEPTNDLDIASLEVLEQSLLDFPGAILLVTHDRFMLDRLSTSILALDGAGGVNAYVDLAQWQAAQEEAKQNARSRPAPPVTPAPAAKMRTKLSYKEQREFDQMESTITAAEADVQRLETLVADPAVLADHVKLQRYCHELGEAHAKVTALYERWAELESRVA